jgi:uncharacterized protein (DUF1697 family)
MTTWIALLRGINVGGHRVVPMKRLRALLSDLGYEDAATYIQSGNCVFRSAGGDAARLAEQIGGAIEAEFGFRLRVFVLGLEQFEAAIAANPFAGRDIDPKFVHLFFLSDPVDGFDETAMRVLAAPGDDFLLANRVFYLLTPAGIGRSRLADKLETLLPVPMTGRNLRSAVRIAELARSISG